MSSAPEVQARPSHAPPTRCATCGPDGSPSSAARGLATPSPARLNVLKTEHEKPFTDTVHGRRSVTASGRR